MSISTRNWAVTGALVATTISLGLVVTTPAGAAVQPVRRAPSVDAGGAGAAPPAVRPARQLPARADAGAASAKRAAPRPATPKYAPKGRPSPAGVAPKAGVAAANFFYGGVRQSAATDGVSASITVARPEIEDDRPNQPHTLAEVSAESADQQQAVEVGWNVDPLVNGDEEPHLFVFHWVNGKPGCYNGCGFQVDPDATVKPGAALPVGALRAFTIRQHGGNWWIGYEGEWIGYFPGTLWGGGFTRTGLVQVFGEVASGAAAPCTDMGNGRFARRATAARISDVVYRNGPAVNLTDFQSTPNLYTAAPDGTIGARFGGPGSGVCS